MKVKKRNWKRNRRNGEARRKIVEDLKEEEKNIAVELKLVAREEEEEENEERLVEEEKYS